MNWKLLILIIVTLQSVWQLLLNAVSARSANRPTPDNVRDVYDEKTYQTWRQYNAEKSRLNVFSTLISWVVTMVLLLLDAHAAVAAMFPANLYVQLLAVVVFQTLVETLAGAGVNYVSTMVIEQKYGFNRSTMKTFVLDQVRSFALEAVLGAVLMSLLCLLHTTMGDWVVVLFTAVVFALTLCISFLYGPVFSRIGNKFVPLEEGELRDQLMALLTSHGYRVKAIEVMDASRRTTKLNAYFTGFGSLKTIVLYDNLVAAMSPEEICAVFAHELGHGLNRDVLKQQVMNLGNLLIMAVLVWFTVRTPDMHLAFGFQQVNYGFAFILLSSLLSLVQPLTGMLMNAYSRHAEFRADRQAVKEGCGEALVTALKKLAKENFSNLSPAPLLVVLEYSHPPLSERIAAITKALAKS